MVQLGGLKHLVLVDAQAPVSFFAYPGKKSYLVPEGRELHELAAPAEDVVGSLEALADALDATKLEPRSAAAVEAGATRRSAHRREGKRPWARFCPRARSCRTKR